MSGIGLKSLIDDAVKAIPQIKPYSAIVYIDGSKAIAEDYKGSLIAEGTAGVDDASVINTVLSSANDNDKICFSGDFLIDSEVVIPDKRLTLDCSQSIFKANASNINIFKVSQTGTLTGIQKLTMIGPKIDFNSKTGCTGIYIYDTYGVVIFNPYIYDTALTNNNTAIKLENIDYWTESTRILSGFVEKVNTAVELTKTGISASFGQSHFELEGEVQTGIKLNTGASLYRSFIDCTFWLDDNCTGLSCDGTLSYLQGILRGEGKGTPTATYLIYLDTNADAIKSDLSIYAGGNFTEVIYNPSDLLFRFRYAKPTYHLKTAATQITDVGVGNVYGNPTTQKSPTGTMLLNRIQVYSSGVAASETFTIKIETVLSDGTTLYLEKSATGADVSAELTLSEIFWSLVKDSLAVCKVNFYAKSDQASTTATAYYRLGALVNI